jgi:hypothetical protein
MGLIFGVLLHSLQATRFVGDRALSVEAAKLWNELPATVNDIFSP